MYNSILISPKKPKSKKERGQKIIRLSRAETSRSVVSADERADGGWIGKGQIEGKWKDKTGTHTAAEWFQTQFGELMKFLLIVSVTIITNSYQ